MPGHARHQGPSGSVVLAVGGDEGAESVREAAAAITRLVRS
jgi:hypothetical protein